MTTTVPVDNDTPLDGAGSLELIEPDSDEDEWLRLAQSNFETSRHFQDASLTVQWERNADHFNNRHFRRSIYNSGQYRGRSKLFRPLARSSERSSSAQFAAAMFSNMQLVDVQAENQNDPIQLASAHIMQKVLQYRLEKTIPWYLTCLGAWQDTRVYGPCYTHTSWEFEEKEVEVRKPKKDLTGKVVKGKFETIKELTVTKDKPVITMDPVENVLMDPQCDWRDPVNSSPYLIRLVPMAMTDILARMNEDDTKTRRSAWKKLDKADILATSRDAYNTVRQAREGDNRTDKTDSQQRDEFKVFWAHENYVRIDGEEFVYWTLGTEHMLTDPVPLRQEYAGDRRPLVAGFSIIEAHRFQPSSATELISGLSATVNEVANQRIDNVRLALNKRYILRRGAMIDLEALMRNVPGGAITTDDPEKDVKVLDIRDVTGSSYKEQERLETESNDLTGTFMGGAVQNNRALNQTVGGMEMLSEGANSISEFDIRTFVESWVKPQLELLIINIQAYETDETVFNVAFEESFKQLGYRYKLDDKVEEQALQADPNETREVMDEDKVAEIKDAVLNNKLTINVNVGLGATSPQRKMDMINAAVGAVLAIPGQEARIDGDAVTKEIFAAAGFQDGSRFIKGMGPGEEEEKITQEDVDAALEQGRQEGTDAAKMASVEAVKEVGLMKVQSEREIRLAELAAKENMTMKQIADKTGIEIQKDATRREIAALQEGNKRNELEYKRTTGKPGI